MALSPTASELNLRYSIRKFFVDGIQTALGITVFFDKSMSSQIQEGLDKWIQVDIGPMDLQNNNVELDIYCCTRKDPLGDNLATVRDSVMGLITDNTQTDQYRRVPLYVSGDPNTVIETAIIPSIKEGGQLESPDQTKFKLMTLQLWWGNRS